MPAAKLTEEEIATRLAEVDGWQRQGDEIRRTYQFPGFPESVAFVDRLAPLAEAAGHHPDIDIRYNKVTLTLTTHDSGGLTANDFAMANQADSVA